MHPSRRSDCEDPVTLATRHTFRPIPHAAARRSSAARPRAGSHGVGSPASGAETRRMPSYGRRGLRRSLTLAELPCPARRPKRDDPSPIREPEPFAAGSLNRHTAAARERFPHQYVPRGADRDVDGPLEGEPWREGRSRLDGASSSDPPPRSGRPGGRGRRDSGSTHMGLGRTESSAGRRPRRAGLPPRPAATAVVVLSTTAAGTPPYRTAQRLRHQPGLRGTGGGQARRAPGVTASGGRPVEAFPVCVPTAVPTPGTSPAAAATPR